ncbi:MAG: hypothetical protein ACXACY_24320 [Candidatus Hodarchaeales archaeon]
MHRLNIEIKKNRDNIVDVLGFAIYGILIIGGIALLYFGVISVLEVLSLLIALLLASIPIYLYFLKKRDQTLLICVTTKYLIERDESRLDDLLGILISGKIERLKIDPIDEFFNSIENFCESDNAEMRRRIAEALPALYQISLENSEEIVSLLRKDWDERWKADNRRRTIESFNYIIGKDTRLIMDNLNVIENDEFITVIAMAEILFSLKLYIGDQKVYKKLKELKRDMKSYGFEQYQIALLTKIWDILELIKKNIKSANEQLASISKNGNELFVQIFAARNFRLLCNGYPKCFKKEHCLGSSPSKSLEFMENFLSKEKHKYVRRPIAKEQSLECLVLLLKNKNYRDRAKNIIWKLVKDYDDIIRITTFDKVDNILDIDKEFGLKIFEYLLSNEKNHMLMDRVKRKQAHINSISPYST